jgi:predicted transcriptional regulator
MDLPELGKLEMRVMKAVWRLGRATVHEVRDALGGSRRLAYTTILTTLRNIERKGYLRHEPSGRSHVFLPAVEERDVARTTLEDLLERVFDGSRLRLVDALFDEADLTDAEYEDLRRRIEDLRKGEGDG